MDEADFLGDRIAIMSKGKLNCCGNSLYLKHKYGKGYSMNIQKTALEVPCDPIMKLIQKIIPKAKLISTAGQNVSIELPEVSHLFKEMCNNLDQVKSELGVLN